MLGHLIHLVQPVRFACAWLLVLAMCVVLPRHASATVPGKNGAIFYDTGYATGMHYQLWSMCPDGTHQTHLADHAIEAAPSPDGTRIAYAGTDDSTHYGIWVMNADGSNPKRLTTKSSDYGPSWSPDGKHIAAISYVPYTGHSSNLQPVLIDPDSGAVTPVLNDYLYHDSSANPPAWTPDGQWLYFTATHNTTYKEGNSVWRVNPMGGTPQLIVDGTSVYNFTWPDVHPDNDRFVISRQTLGATGPVENMQYNLNGGNPITISNGVGFGGDSGDGVLTYSPDGKKMTLVSMVHNEVSLAVANADGSDVTWTNNYGTRPRWSTYQQVCGAHDDPGHPDMTINEVLLPGSGSAQFVELVDPDDDPYADAGAPYRVVVYDAAGKRVGAHTISTSLLQGRDNGEPLLIGNAAADQKYGSHRDETLSVSLPDTGQACFTKGKDETRTNCVSWGCVSTSVASPETIAIAYPVDGKSTQRQGTASSAFKLAKPTPGATNTTGVSGKSCLGALTASSKPSIAGTVITGSTVTAQPGTWNASGTNYTYQWLRGGKAITQAHKAKYKLTEADFGHKVSVRVTATAPGHPTGTAASPARTVGKGDALHTRKKPTVHGTPKVGNTLTASMAMTAWSPHASSLSFQWLRGTKQIAHGKHYQLVAADRGKQITSRVLAHRHAYHDGKATKAVSVRG